jgi:hypothetical protein
MVAAAALTTTTIIKVAEVATAITAAVAGPREALLLLQGLIRAPRSNPPPAVTRRLPIRHPFRPLLEALPVAVLTAVVATASATASLGFGCGCKNC